MSDHTVSGALIDVSELSLSDLLDEVDESSLAWALQRIVGSAEDGVGQQNEFNSSI
jgi:FXSXX-COOH protein